MAIESGFVWTKKKTSGRVPFQILWIAVTQSEVEELVMLSFVLIVVVVAVVVGLQDEGKIWASCCWITTSRPSRSEVFRFGKFLRIVGIFVGFFSSPNCRCFGVCPKWAKWPCWNTIHTIPDFDVGSWYCLHRHLGHLGWGIDTCLGSNKNCGYPKPKAIILLKYIYICHKLDIATSQRIGVSLNFQSQIYFTI